MFERCQALEVSIPQSSALRVGKGLFIPATDVLERSRALTKELLERNFPAGEEFYECEPALAD